CSSDLGTPMDIGGSGRPPLRSGSTCGCGGRSRPLPHGSRRCRRRALEGEVTIVVALFCAGILLRPRRSRTETVPLRLVLIVLLVEIGSGRSVLAALQAAAARLPDHRDLPRAARLAAVAGP